MYFTRSLYSFTVRKARSKNRPCHSRPGSSRSRLISRVELTLIDSITPDRTRIMRKQDGVSVVRKKNPGRYQKIRRLAAKSNSPCQNSEFGLTQKAMPMSQPAGYKEETVGDNEPPQTKHRDAL